MEDRKVYSVGEITKILKDCIDGFPFFQNLSIKGEISNFKRYDFGCYFDIKDEVSPLPCVIFAREPGFYRFAPKNGDLYVLTGRIGVYPKGGRYQFYVREGTPLGTGSLLEKREALKKKLAAEGLFDEKRKRPLPVFPRRIGIITAHPSAAEADITKNCFARWPLTDLIVYPSAVQGAGAPAEIIEAIKKAEQGNIDILVIARGGGSSEDLSAFDDEGVVRAVASSKVPTVTAVGHEVDFTLVDFASDLRVSTPTAAASAILPDAAEVSESIAESSRFIVDAAARYLKKYRDRVEMLASRSYFVRPDAIYARYLEKTDDLGRRMILGAKRALESRKTRLESLERRLTVLDPKGVLERGYAINTVGGKVIRSVKDARKGEKMETMLSDGIIVSTVDGGKENA